MELKKIIISTGGTGGHIYPAIAVAELLSEKFRGLEILFVGAKNKMEMEKVPKAGYPIKGLWISGLQRKLTFGNLLFPVKLIVSIGEAFKILNQFKPDVVIGFGGYASGAMLYAACLKKIPTLIHEQNSYAGITNKILKNKVNTICVAYEGMEKYFPANKIVLTGNPVRKDIINNAITKQQAHSFFKLPDNNKPTLLVTGGSLGARTLNQSIYKYYHALLSYCNIIWQKGKKFPEADNLYASGLYVADFIYEMNMAYSAADMVLSRAGALTIAELQVAARAAVLVPSPNVAEDHQTKNALALVNKHAALMVKDDEAISKLPEAIISLSQDEAKRKLLSENIQKMAKPDATQHIVEEIEKLLIKHEP